MHPGDWLLGGCQCCVCVFWGLRTSHGYVYESVGGREGGEWAVGVYVYETVGGREGSGGGSGWVGRELENVLAVAPDHGAVEEEGEGPLEDPVPDGATPQAHRTFCDP